MTTTIDLWTELARETSLTQESLAGICWLRAHWQPIVVGVSVHEVRLYVSRAKRRAPRPLEMAIEKKLRIVAGRYNIPVWVEEVGM